MTHGDKIRSMTDYDLADFLCAIVSCCGNGACGEFCPLWKCCNDQESDNIENWLKQEVESDG